MIPGLGRSEVVIIYPDSSSFRGEHVGKSSSNVDLSEHNSRHHPGPKQSPCETILSPTHDTMTGWWYTHPSEKWWSSSSWDYDIPNRMESHKNLVPNHQPDDVLVVLPPLLQLIPNEALEIAEMQKWRVLQCGVLN